MPEKRVYIGEMAEELADMAREAGSGFLAHLLDMAAQEAAYMINSSTIVDGQRLFTPENHPK